MNWLLKDKVENPTLKRLAIAINSYNGSNLVSTEESTYYTTTLPFFIDFKLISFIDLSFCPYLEIRLLDNGKTTFILDGTQKPFIEAGSISPLLLTSRNVYQYAALVLGDMNRNDNSYRLVTSINDIHFSEEPTKEQYQLLESSIQMAKIKKNPIHIKLKHPCFLAIQCTKYC
ncbi:MAG: hypothetical protein EHM93_15580 [Bacteroidales bacterium]|nr:MAG: hypothetical protein EHM93_15580 [Bacteroidales bacterium]